MDLVQTAAARWQEVLKTLAQKMPPGSFDTWFRDAEIIAFDDERIEIGVANLFAKSWLEKKYLTLLAEAIASVHGLKPSIKISISPQRFREMRERQRQEGVHEKVPAAKDVPPSPSLPYLNPALTWESFVVGAGNRLAYAACQRLLARPAEYNPVLLYGGHGLGKTHLLQALCHILTKRQPAAKAIYLPADAFVHEFTAAHQAGGLAAFRQHLRTCDWLFIDDFHVLAQGKKEASQEELLRVLEVLKNARRQVIFAADRSLEEMRGLSPRLRNRLAAGLAIRLDPPDEEARRAIAVRKAAERNLTLPPPVVERIGREILGSVREIEGAVGCLAAMASLTGLPITVESCNEIFGQRTVRPPQPTLAEIVAAVSGEFQVPREDIIGRRRQKSVRSARIAALLLARRLLPLSLSELGEFFGKRSHVTILATLRSSLPLRRHTALARAIENILAKLGYRAEELRLYEEQARLFAEER